jgi:putative spermidine/putrescine transport system permease protein
MKKKTHTRKKAGNLLSLLPGMVIIACGFLLPLFILFAVSIYEGIPGTGQIIKKFTFANYTRLLDPFYFAIIWKTFVLSLSATVLSLIMGYPVAFAMTRGSARKKTILLAIVLTPLITNVVARTMGLMIMLGTKGPINQLLNILGVPSIKIVPGNIGIVIGMAQVFMPYMILSIHSVLENINYSLQEAARDMGCTKWQSFRKVIFPLSMPGVVAGSLFVFLLSFSSYVTPRLLGGSKTITATALIYQQAMQVLDWPFAAAAATVLFVLSVTLVTGYNRMTSRIEQMMDRVGTYRNKNFSTSIFGNTYVNVRDFFYDFQAMVCRSWRRLDKHGFTAEIQKIITTLMSVLLKIFIVLVIMFILMPLPVVIISSFSESQTITFPPTSYSLKWYADLLSRTEYISALKFSLKLATISVVISLVTGTLAALGISRSKNKYVNILKTYFLSPIMVPAVITGIALLRYMVHIGLAGTFWALLIGHVVITSAYVVRSVLSSLVGFDMSMEEAARDLGATPFYTFRKITLPIIKPGVIVAALFSFIVSLDETTVSLFLVGGRTTTLSVKIFSQLEFGGLNPTVTAISSILIICAVFTLFLIDKVIGLNKFKI